MKQFCSKTTYDFICAPVPSTGKILKLEPQEDIGNFLGWLKANKHHIEKQVSRYGGVLLRNFAIESVSAFSKAVQVLCPELLDYTYRSTPRLKLGGQIYTATEYPKNRSIPFHNENSYSRIWPNKLFFYSAIVAEQGGETPIADSRNVYSAIDSVVREKFERLGVRYIRNYTHGIDLSWQEVFQTDSKADVEHYCRKHNITFEWCATEPQLRTKQVCQATIIHPQTQKKIWFNQAHLFHPSAIDAEEHVALINMLGKENLPRNVFYGNGEPIEEEFLDHIREVYIQEKITFSWQRGDLIYLDNRLMAHSREPYAGERKVAVAMGL
jgi:alpha-ketoglutarate-dependent taurine dioxygenase